MDLQRSIFNATKHRFGCVFLQTYPLSNVIIWYYMSVFIKGGGNMKYKMISIVISVVFLLIIFNQYQQIKLLEATVGSNYQMTVRGNINNMNNVQLDSNKDIELSLYAYSLIEDSLALSRLPNPHINVVAEDLKLISEKLLKNEVEELNIQSINTDLKRINEYLIYINNNISEDTRAWYKEFESPKSEILEQAWKQYEY